MTCKHILPMESNVSSYLQHSVSGPWICPWCERDAFAAENARLRARLADCELALDVWDTGRCSEYWLRVAVQPSEGLQDG